MLNNEILEIFAIHNKIRVHNKPVEFLLLHTAAAVNWVAEDKLLLLRLLLVPFHLLVASHSHLVTVAAVVGTCKLHLQPLLLLPSASQGYPRPIKKSTIFNY